MEDIDKAIEAHGGWPGTHRASEATNELDSGATSPESLNGDAPLDMVAETKHG